MQARTGIHLSGTLVFVESDERYSVYRAKADGEYVYLAHGTGTRLVDLDDLDVDALWQEFVRHWSVWDAFRFRDIVRDRLIEAGEADELEFCSDCGSPVMEDDRCSVRAGIVCESCSEEYSYCECCEESCKDVTSTLDDTSVCERCRSNYWSWCEDCDGYYRDDDSHEHAHDDGCCEAPGQNFTVRNDGEPPLANDTRANVTLPAGVISDEGIGEIGQYLRDHSYTLDTDEATYNLRSVSYRLSELGTLWQTKEGNFTKRLSRFAYKEHGLKLVPEVVSRVGCIARDHSTAINFEIEVTRDLNLSASEFAHDDSCWWQSYSSSRCALKSNGGFGLRTFNSYGVTGRAWVMPLRKTLLGLIPTFDTQTPDAFVVFNGYGDLSGYVGTRIISHMAGMTYRKIGFSCSPMYVNNDSGYLVAPEEIATEYTDGSLYLNVETHADLFNNERNLINA